MSTYSRLSTEIDVQAGMVREFNTKVRRLKELTSHGPSRGTPEQINSEHDAAFKLSKEILNSFRRNTPNRSQKLQHDKLAKEFESLLSQFNSINKTVISVNKEVSIEPKKIEEVEDPEMKKFKTVGHIDDVALKERREVIGKMEEDIVEVNSMFKEVAQMLGEQGEMLVEADKNADVAVKETSRAVEDMQKANQSQRSAKDKLVVICILILVILVFLILVVLGYLYF
jgi:t-SNARE complex subunit (syntaxin)